MTSLVEASALVWPGAGSSQADAMDFDLRDVASASIQTVSQAVLGFVGAATDTWRRKRARATPAQQPSIDEAWVADLVQGSGYVQVMDRTTFRQDHGIFPSDHLFRVLLEQGLIHDARVLFRAGELAPAGGEQPPAARGCRVVSATLMGPGVCGHPGILHGGMTAALIDEACGYLLYIGRHRGLLDFPAVVTASLEVAYKQPLVPSEHCVAVTAWVREVTGRKIWVDVVVSDVAYEGDDLPAPGAGGRGGAGSDVELAGGDRPASRVFATGKALFVVPRPSGSSAALLESQAAGKQLLGQSLMALAGSEPPQPLQRQAGPRYEGNPADV